MKITSRPEGSKESLNLNELSNDEVELICAFLYATVLGSGTAYSKAAFEFLNRIEERYGSDFIDQASSRVDLHAVKLDPNTMNRIELLGPSAFELIV